MTMAWSREPEDCTRVEGAKQARDLLLAEDVHHLLLHPGDFHFLELVGVGIAFSLQPVEEGPDCAAPQY
jgi:hypothetical protein